MRSIIERWLSKLSHYLLGVIHRQLKIAETELQKHSEEATFLGVGILCLVLGRISGITYLSLIGALGIAIAFLKGLK
jgi:hypothetical protein